MSLYWRLIEIARRDMGEAEPDEEVVWSRCADCDSPIFRHYSWSHQGGTPPQDHEAQPRD